jgi:hypothetical protein
MKKIAIGIATIAALIGTPVLAADMAMKAPPPARASDPGYNWSGFYFGVNGGGAWATTSDSNAFFAATTGNFHINGGILGGQAGYNWELPSRWVLGIESDFDGSTVKGSTSAGLCTGVVCTIENTWLGTTRARVAMTPALGCPMPPAAWLTATCISRIPRARCIPARHVRAGPLAPASNTPSPRMCPRESNISTSISAVMACHVLSLPAPAV